MDWLVHLRWSKKHGFSSYPIPDIEKSSVADRSRCCCQSVHIKLLTISFCILLTIFYGAAVVNPTSFYGEQVEILLADKVQLLADTFSISQKEVVVSTATFATLIYACTVVIHSWFMIIVVKCAQYFREKYEETLPVTSSEEEEKPVSVMENSIQINQENIKVL